ncbi:MAG: SDR family oxidoreductase [Candidatus Lindowbacteria bacterium]|nr:SDR family oxidoreductase [Candidatus Lindowbacteria bacterium]
MRALVTGCAGFLGSHLVEKLLAEGFDVVGMDNFLTSTSANIDSISGNFEFIEHDVTEYIEIEGPLDRIYHFASPASPIDYRQFPIQTLKVGALGTHNALGVAKAKGARLLLASTSEVYGDPLVNPQREDYWGNVNPIGPRGVYDEAKRFAEAMVMAYQRFHGLETRIVRIFNTYGPRMRLTDGRAIPTFISQIMEDKPITVFGDGLQTRSFCFVSDLIDGLFRLMELAPQKASTGSENIIGPVNIGNPDEKTLLDLARVLYAVAGKEVDIEFHPLPIDDPKVRRPDITKARTLLNWQPTIGLEDGLRRTYEWYAK